MYTIGSVSAGVRLDGKKLRAGRDPGQGGEIVERQEPRVWSQRGKVGSRQRAVGSRQVRYARCSSRRQCNCKCRSRINGCQTGSRLWTPDCRLLAPGWSRDGDFWREISHLRSVKSGQQWDTPRQKSREKLGKSRLNADFCPKLRGPPVQRQELDKSRGRHAAGIRMEYQPACGTFSAEGKEPGLPRKTPACGGKSL
jgi:hypothetical protein